MNKEIKEILEILDGIASGDWIQMLPKEANKLLDYITNLQQNYDRIYNENCKLREEHNITDISLLDENYKLQQENERLKQIKSCMINFQECYVVKDYKSRIDKAIEYIKENQEHRQGLTVIEYHKKWLEMYDYYESASIMSDLLNILQNGSENDE